jgi:hypothetical protein
MKKIFVTAFLLMTVSELRAEEGFEASKQKAIEQLTKRQSNIESAKGCIKSAANRESMKLCYKDLKEDQGALRMEKLEDRQKKMNNRIEKRKTKLKESKK